MSTKKQHIIKYSGLFLFMVMNAIMNVNAAIELKFNAPKNGYITLVIEDTTGRRIYNLVGEYPVKAGENIIKWDLRDNGVVTNRRKFCDYVIPFYLENDITRNPVKAGKYRLRGLFHEGIYAKYEFAIYTGSGLTSPWRNSAGTGGWIADHTPPRAVKYIPANSGSPYSKEPHILIGCGGGEAGHNFIACDLNGKKLFGSHVGGFGPSWGDQCAAVWGACDCKPVSEVTDKDGNKYVIHASTHQVKKYDRTGKEVLTIGKVGGPQLGAYDEEKMCNPSGIAVTENGQLWVAENSQCPRRISVWSTSDGKFLKAFYGSVRYGGGGTIDPLDSTRFYYAPYGDGGMEFKLDWASGTAKLAYIYFQKGKNPGDALPGYAPDRALYINGKQFMINNYNVDYNGCGAGGVWIMGDDHIVRPCAIWTDLEIRKDFNNDWAISNFKSQWPQNMENGGDAAVMWTDQNGNANVDAGEFEFAMFDYKGTLYTQSCSDTRPWKRLRYNRTIAFNKTDFSFMTNWGSYLSAPTFNTIGVPKWNIAGITFPVGVAEYHQGLFFKAEDGWIIHYFAPIVGYKDGKVMWEYQNQWPDRGGDNPPVQQYPGQIVGPARMLGFPLTPPAGECGEFFVLNGDKGEMYFMTTDGLFIMTLGGDKRAMPYLRSTDFTRGMIVYDKECFSEEQFFPSINQTKNGGIYLVAGQEHSGIYRLDGWEKVQRVDYGIFEVTQNDLSGISSVKAIGDPKKIVKVVIVWTGNRTITVDGHVNDWTIPDTMWCEIDATTFGAIYIGTTYLYAAFKTSDTSLLVNSGADGINKLFTTGGALDLMLGMNYGANQYRTTAVEGDIRLLVTRVGAKTKAVVYRPEVAGVPDEQRIRFSSPIGETFIDKIDDVSDHVQLASRGGNYEFSIPLNVLGFEPQAGRTYRGDIGVLRGDGMDTKERVYWNNKFTSLTADIPSEARLSPNNWGGFRIRADAGGPSTILTNLSGIEDFALSFGTGGRLLQLSNPFGEEISLELFDFSGRMIFRVLLPYGKHKIDIKKYANKTYLVCIRGKHNKKIYGRLMQLGNQYN